MKYQMTPPVYGSTNQLYRMDGLFKEVRVPDLLVRHNSDYKALSSDEVLYFTKDGNIVRVYCIDRRSYMIDLSICQLWSKISRRHKFHKVSKYLIVNSNHIMSIKKNGHKLIFLRNGEEIDLDESLFSDIMDSVIMV